MTRFSKRIQMPKVQVIALLVTLGALALPAGEPQSKMLLLGYGLLTALLSEWAVWGKVKPTQLQSAAITGLLVGAITAPSGNLLIVWTASLAAILSKRILQTKNLHFFNPAAFGLIASGMIFSNQFNWWGSSSPALLILAGGLILLRLKRLALPFSYFITRTLSATLVGMPIETALSLPNLLFAFIMLIEPKTSPSRPSEQWIFGGVCGAVSTFFYQVLPLDGDLSSLLVLNAAYAMNRRHPIRNLFKRGETHEH